MKAINAFWEGLNIKQDKLTIDGDSHLMIYIYVTIASAVQDLFAQIKFINEFSTPFVRTTKLGYCTTTLEVAVNQIISMSKDELIVHEGPEQIQTESDQFFNQATNKRPSKRGIWNEERRSLSHSLRESLSMSSRAASLVIENDAIDNPFFYRTSSHQPRN